jgi:hypothetical protein
MGTTVAISSLRGFHSGGTTTQVLKHGGVPVLIDHAVALKDNTALELPFGVTIGELRILFHAECEEVTKVHLDAVISSLTGNVFPLTHRRLVPNDLRSQAIPFKSESLTGLRVASDFSLSDRTGHHGGERNGAWGKFVTVDLMVIGKDTSPRVLSRTMRGSPEATHRHAGNSVSSGRVIAKNGPGTLGGNIIPVDSFGVPLLIIDAPRRENLIFKVVNIRAKRIAVFHVSNRRASTATISRWGRINDRLRLINAVSSIEKTS